jgi:hypothetical protein
MNPRRNTGLCALSVLISFTSALTAQEPSSAEVDQAAELAKKLANPVANLVSVPFQANHHFGIGGRCYVEAAIGGSEWCLSAGLTLLFPAN